MSLLPAKTWSKVNQRENGFLGRHVLYLQRGLHHLHQFFHLLLRHPQLILLDAHVVTPYQVVVLEIAKKFTKSALYATWRSRQIVQTWLKVCQQESLFHGKHVSFHHHLRLQEDNQMSTPITHCKSHKKLSSVSIFISNFVNPPLHQTFHKNFKLFLFIIVINRLCFSLFNYHKKIWCNKIQVWP